MKRYGQAEYMWHIIEKFINDKMTMLTAEQKEQLKKKCRAEVFQKYASVRELEVSA